MNEVLAYIIITAFSVSLLPNPKDTSQLIGVVISVILGIVLRIGFTMQTGGKITKLGFYIQLMITIPICYLSYHLFVKYQLLGWLTILMTISSFMAVYLVRIMDRIGKIYAKITLSGIFKSIYNKVLALEKEGDR